MSQEIDHIVVLMLENRSFDHMLGFMNYPEFQSHRLKGDEFNKDSQGRPIQVSMDAEPIIQVDPGHYLNNTMWQVYERKPEPGRFPPPSAATNGGFVVDYENVARQQRAPIGYGKNIMRCFNPARETRVLATLAREFAVCPRWFCSVPAATWPNRNYAHAATSHGRVDNPVWYRARGLFKDKTIFEQLDAAKGSWNVFTHSYLYQAMGFEYVVRNSARVRWMKEFYEAVENDRLPQYSFIEPYHIWSCNSQHSYYVGNNQESFARGEKLIADLYNALRARPDVFQKTLFLITYDEHGGFFDRVAPPAAVAPDAHRSPEGFDFGRLGVRVPAVLVSPRIQARTVDTTVYDHASIPKTVRTLFAAHQGSLTRRDAEANPFHRVASGPVRSDLPDIVPPQLSEPDDEGALSAERLSEYDGFQTSLLDLALGVGRAREREQAGESLTQALAEAFDQSPSLVKRLASDRALYARLEELAPLLVGQGE